MTNLIKNHGFDKCKTFDEIAMLALRRVLDINDSGLAKANIRVSRKQIDVYFYKDPQAYAAYYTHGSIASGGATLEDLDDAFVKHESKGMEVCHA